jgi:hypothetical protein
MSQSDYLQRKRIATELQQKNQRKFKNTIDSENYTLYKQYTLENNVVNTSPRFNQTTPPGATIVYNMEVYAPATCPSFVICENTQRRPYHQNIDPISFNPAVSMRLPYVSSYTGIVADYQPKQLKYMKETPAPLRKCHGCCYDSSLNKVNTWTAPCGNRRLKSMTCGCVNK